MQVAGAEDGKTELLHGLPAQRISTLNLKPLSQWEVAMRERVDNKVLPGFCACVVHHGEVVHLAEYGYADIERKEPFTKDSIVRVYCITKTAVAVGILMLMERNCLKLSDPICKYLPAFKNLRFVRHGNAVLETDPDTQPVTQKCTILRLLTHTAGFGYGADFGEKPTGGMDRMYQPLLQALDRREIRSLEDYCKQLAKLPLRFRPGKALNYAMGHDVLGRIIEVITGQSLDVFLHTEIFGPLGMEDTGFFVPEQKASRLAALYCNAERAGRMAKLNGYLDGKQDDPIAPLLHRIDGSTPSESNWFEGKHCTVLSGNGILGSNMGGLVSTVSDQAKFFTMLLNGGVLGDCRILQTSTVHEWCFTDLLPLPGATGKHLKNGQPWSGWSALGERGQRRTKRDPMPKSDEYEEGEVAMGGAANTTWSVNPVRDTVTLFFTQALDSYLWRPDAEAGCWREPQIADLGQVGTGGVGAEPSPENFTAAVRAVAPRDSQAALQRRMSLSAHGQSTLKRKAETRMPRKGVKRKRSIKK
mmetsp:Transcript_160375/g.292876  ORF Transcript_160375/g.292876 Transcript_160375/m.292876 type:complete len:530 (-) Transcript_160375:203-1792(-)